MFRQALFLALLSALLPLSHLSKTDSTHPEDITHDYLQSDAWRERISELRQRLTNDGLLSACPLFSDDFSLYRWLYEHGWMGTELMVLMFRRASSTLNELGVAKTCARSLAEMRKKMVDRYPEMGRHPAGVVDYDRRGDLVTLIMVKREFDSRGFSDESSITTVKSALMYRLIRYGFSQGWNGVM